MSGIAFMLHGATLALAWFLALNIAATLGVAIASAWLTRQARTVSPGAWLALRLLPSALSIAFVALIFLPSYWRYEPRGSVEGFDVSLTTLAILAFSIVCAAAVRGVSAWRRAARRTDAWMRAGRPLSLAGTSIPAFAIDADAPLMALVGVLRPCLVVARPVLESLTDEELRACVGHELGHWRSWDNLKRLAMRSAPDVLVAFPAARAIEQRWAAASEHAADRGAGDSGPARCALASALVKVARLTPPILLASEPISALVEGGDIAARVRRLLDDAPSISGHRWIARTALAIPAAALVLDYAPLLRTVHAVTEILVSSLP